MMVDNSGLSRMNRTIFFNNGMYINIKLLNTQERIISDVHIKTFFKYKHMMMHNQMEKEYINKIKLN